MSKVSAACTSASRTAPSPALVIDPLRLISPETHLRGVRPRGQAKVWAEVSGGHEARWIIRRRRHRSAPRIETRRMKGATDHSTASSLHPGGSL
jgi:hypothetical protein